MTGHHAAASAGVKKGDVVAVVGDGAVGLCAVIAAKRLGAERIIAVSRNAARQKLAREFGATDVVPERGQEAAQKILEMTGGVGVDAALECVGVNESMQTAFAVARPGWIVGAIGTPHGVQVPIGDRDLQEHRSARRRVPGAPIHPGSPRRRPLRKDSPGPRLRLRHDARPHQGGVRRHGRTAGDQVAPPDRKA